jgi:hypothetical protein
MRVSSRASSRMTRRAPHVRVLAATSLAVALATAGAPTASVSAGPAAPTIEVLRASLGAKGANGTATLSVFASGDGSVRIVAKALRPASSYAVAIRRGTCTNVGPVIVSLPNARTSKKGAVTVPAALAAAQVAAVTSEVRATGRVVVRLGAGAAARCGTLKVASRSPRVGSTALRLQAPDGSPLAGVPVTYAQTTHDFLFGVGMTAPDSAIPLSVFGQLAGVGVNYALPYVSWHMTEPEPGGFTFGNPDGTYRPADMRALGYTLNGHSVIHFLDQSFNLPAYVRGMSFDELKTAVSAHVRAVAEHYRGTLQYWTISEPTWPDADPFHLSTAQWVEIVRTASDAIRAADPAAEIMVVVVPLDLPDVGYSATGILDALAKAKVGFDAIGIEVYPFFFEKDRDGYPAIPAVSARLDDFARFRKPVFISEMGVTDSPSPEAQAAWLRAVYSMAFEKPDVAGLVWYFVVDDPFLPGGGLFPDAASPARPTYTAMADVIAQRTSAGSAVSDAHGVVRIEGYGGDYTVEVGSGAALERVTVHVSEGRDRSVVGVVNGSTVTILDQ